MEFAELAAILEEVCSLFTSPRVRKTETRGIENGIWRGEDVST
jgi:hypothetical protein